ncbi:MAG: tRNA lysidine(34) synthetase TilS [Acidobacteriaceae bacterium]|nr:tRNA lysidine(34) synthetase TilS [Acidobacteriaceae bacterium]
MSLLANSLVDRVGEIITRYSMLRAHDRVGVAVSGGGDSVALLHILRRLSAQFDLELLVLHLNHQLRGTESDLDESFVRALASRLGLKFVVQHGDPPAGNIEQATRLARQRFFSHSKEHYGLARIALGHTRGDQAETVLYRLIRGSGLAGLAGMRMATDGGLIRPLLTTSREEVRSWADAEGIDWREDASNRDLRFARNRLRHEIIPQLAEHFNAGIESVLARMAEIAQDEEDHWAQEVEPVYSEITKRTQLGLIFQLSLFVPLDRAVQRRVIRRGIRELRGDLRSIDLDHVEAIRRICASEHGHDRVMVPGIDALRSFEELLMTTPNRLASKPRGYRVELKLDTWCKLPFDTGWILVKRLGLDEENCVSFKVDQQFALEIEDLAGEAIGLEPSQLFIRNWEPGDALLRPGHNGVEKIKSLFHEYRVALWERRHWPVLVAGGEIVWARRFGAAAKFRASAESRQRLRLVYRPVEVEMR